MTGGVARDERRRSPGSLPDVTGLDKEFDYLVPDGCVDRVTVGVDRARAAARPARRAAGSSQLDPPDADVAVGPAPADRRRSSSRGPDAGADRARRVGVACAGPPAGCARSSSPPARRRTSPALPPPAHGAPAPASSRSHAGAADAARRRAAGCCGSRRPATSLPTRSLAAAGRGPTLVVDAVGRPGPAAMAHRAAPRRARASPSCPQEWARGRRRASTSSSARGPRRGRRVPDLRRGRRVDEHDEALQEERSPTWHARDVVVERARRAGVAGAAGVAVPDASTGARRGRRARWSRPADRRRARRAGRSSRSSTAADEEPWKTSLVTSPLIAPPARRRIARVVCVHNTPGRARHPRLPHAAGRCCAASAATRPSASADDGTLRVPALRHRCARRCACACGASAFANLRPGVTRLREELEAAAGRPVVAVTGRDDEPPAAGRRLRRHRGGAAPGRRRRRRRLPRLRPRAAGAALPGGRAGDGAARPRRPGCVGPRAPAAGGCWCRRSCPATRSSRPRCSPTRRGWSSRSGPVAALLGLPPFAALAAISGPGQRRASPTRCAAVAGIDVGGGDGRYIGAGGDVGRARRRPHRRPPPEGHPRPHRRRPAPPVSAASECSASSRRSADTRCPTLGAGRRRAGGSPWPTRGARSASPASPSQRCSESAPRCFCTTRTARPSGGQPASHVASSSWSAVLPMRIGGFDQISVEAHVGRHLVGRGDDDVADAVGARRWPRTAPAPAR